MAERVGFEPTYSLLSRNSISSRARYDHFGTSPAPRSLPKSGGFTKQKPQNAKTTEYTKYTKVDFRVFRVFRGSDFLTTGGRRERREWSPGALCHCPVTFWQPGFQPVFLRASAVDSSHTCRATPPSAPTNPTAFPSMPDRDPPAGRGTSPPFCPVR